MNPRQAKYGASHPWRKRVDADVGPVREPPPPITVDASTTVGVLSVWFEAHGVYPTATRGRQGNWVVDLVGPRGGLRARGIGKSWLEATTRAVRNLCAGVAP